MPVLGIYYHHRTFGMSYITPYVIIHLVFYSAQYISVSTLSISVTLQTHRCIEQNRYAPSVLLLISIHKPINIFVSSNCMLNTHNYT